MLTLLGKKNSRGWLGGFAQVILIIFLLCAPALHAEKTGHTITPHFSQEKNNINVCVRLLTKADMRVLFNCYNPIKIVRLTNHYKAFEITIENKTEQEYVLAHENIDLKLENTLVIKSKVKANPILIPFFTGIAITALLVSGIGLATLPSVIAGMAIGVTALNLNMQKSNKFSTKNIQTKVLDAYHATLIPSYSKIQKIVFVSAKNAKNRFAIALESLGASPLDLTQKISFDVVLTNKPYPLDTSPQFLPTRVVTLRGTSQATTLSI